MNPKVRVKAQRGFVPYVGRKEEGEFLSDCLKDALRGNGCSIFVCGEPGIGKTRLVSTVLDEVEASSNCLVLKGQAYQYEKPLAYQPFTQAIRHLHRINLSQKDFEKVLNPYRPCFQLLLPDIGNLENNNFQEQPAAKYGLFEGLLSLFLSLSENHPLVLFIDDLHWMDEQSLELFSYIAHQIDCFPIALLGCYRDAEVLPDGTLARLLSQLKRADSLLIMHR
jgi:predicted ATPase